jgi:hypothetical protein
MNNAYLAGFGLADMKGRFNHISPHLADQRPSLSSRFFKIGPMWKTVGTT